MADRLKDSGIPTAVYYPITLDQQPALSSSSRLSGELTTTHALASEVISLPMHPYLSEQDMLRITDAVKAALA